MRQISPDDALLDAAVEEFARATGFQLAFGGFEHEGIATVTALAGNRTQSLQGLRVEIGRGLGGRSLTELRPRLTTDYRRSKRITHDYDDRVLPEGVVSLFAYPIIHEGRVRALLYGGTRSGGPPHAAFIHRAASVAREFVQELRISDEVARRVSALAPPSEIPGTLIEELRIGHAELRALAAAVDDPEVRGRLEALEHRLARATGGGAAAPSPNALPVRLTRRELDVLSQAAIGSSNAAIGLALGLTESTVKSYMKAAMSKLDASTRHAAVASARRQGLIL